MVTVHRFGSFRVVISLNDHLPPHVHVFRGTAEMRVMLETVQVVWQRGFGPIETRRIRNELKRIRDRLRQKWDEIHG